MIIFRYLSKQILQVTAAVTLILLIVALTSRFIQYLGDAVAGQLASDILLLLMLYRLPDFLLVILPLAYFLGIILVYGRMHADNEMVILSGSGFSPRRLLGFTLGTAVIVMLLVASLSLYLAPWGVRNTEQLKLSQEQLTEIDLIVAGQFQIFGSGDRVTYAESIRSTEAGRQLQNVFVALSRPGADNQEPPRIVLASTAQPEVDPETGARFMRLEDVQQYDGNPGSADFSVGQFAAQGILLPEPTEFEEVLEEATLPIATLFGSDELAHRAELQWRVSILLLVPIISLIAVPMSNVKPRQGRYSKLIPAALIYATYFVLLQFCRDLIAEGSLSATLGLWWIHALFLLLAVAMLRFPRVLQALRLA
ncbi:MAG: LPS export ABC transporter permease LptF [Gammaproteobacteria bacterium]